jgi:hypothetical protein
MSRENGEKRGGRRRQTSVTEVTLAAAAYVTSAAVNWAFAHAMIEEPGTAAPPLYDLGHSLTRTMRVPEFIPVYAVFIVLGYGLARVILTRRYDLLVTFMRTMTLLYAIRLLAFTMTVMPPARPRRSSVDVSIVQLPFETCTDYMYSGHAAHMVLVMTLLSTTVTALELALGLAVTVVGCCSMVILRFHYTSDVIVGAAMAVSFGLLASSSNQNRRLAGPPLDPDMAAESTVTKTT